MIINIDENILSILDKAQSLNTIAKSQLSFWQFNYDRVSGIYSATMEQQRFLKLIQYFKNEDINFTLSATATVYLEELEEKSSDFFALKQNAENFKNGIIDKPDFNLFQDFVLTHIKRPLKVHQLKAAYHLYILGNGANFSVPGSGKTSVVLTVYEKLKQEGKVNTLFVVGPPSSFGPWRNEFVETLGRKPSYRILAGGNKSDRKKQYYHTSNSKAELYLISFHTLLFDQTDVNHFLKQKHVSAFFIVDEAHYMKQLKGNWSQAVMKQAEKSKFRCVLTGTPMPKSYTDIFNLFDFLWPGQNVISTKDKNLIKYNEQLNNNKVVKTILDKNVGQLFYRVRKMDLDLMPQVFKDPILVEMNPYERTIYDAVFNKIKNYSQKDFFKNIDFINKMGRGRIIRLRQSVSYSKLLTTAIDNYDEKLLDDLSDIKNLIYQYDTLEIPGKLQELLKLVRLLSKKKLKVVIWSNFINTIKLIEKQLKNQGYNCKKIFGETPVEGTTTTTNEETREKIRDEFVDPNSGLDILIANPAACAESISLHKTCHHAIYYDLAYNCAQYLQSLDRIHRVGGSETISANYYFLQYKNTIDRDIKENVDKKTRKMFEIIEEDYSIYSLNMFEDDGDNEAYNRLFKKKRKD